MDKRPIMGRRTLTFLCCVLAIPTAARLIDGLKVDTMQTALLAGALLGVCYLLLRPLLRLFSLPIGCLTLGLSNFAIDVGLIFLLSNVMPGFTISSMLPAVLTAILVNGVCMVVGGLR
ncbi:phage holin family protein [Eubacteriales bacterium OttesenSCG-928-N13]|nr:phage holin family protein [Eubacteriales bacterium OttesenSCG-928-N13]